MVVHIDIKQSVKKYILMAILRRMWLKLNLGKHIDSILSCVHLRMALLWIALKDVHLF